MMAERVRFSSNDARTLITAYGFHIFPVHGIDDNMHCTCGDPLCESQGKHPACPNGCSDATADITEVLRLWGGRKGLNVGIATGKASNCFVVDIDGPQAEKDLQDLIEKHGELPDTLQQTTGRGRHLFFKYPKNVQKIKTRRGVIGEKIDIRGDGGYVVGYKSTHKTGAVYNFVNPLEAIETAPQWLIDIIMDENKPVDSNVLPLYSVPTKSPFSSSSDWSQDQIKDLLSYIDPDCGYDEWYQIGMAIKDYGLPFQLWDEWSKRGTKYNANEMAGKWNSFKGNGISIGSLVYHAKQGGWRPAAIEQRIERTIPKMEPLIQHDAETGEVIEIGESDKKEGKRIFPIFFADDVAPVTDCSDFVEDVLREREFSVIYGASNCGKTFFMLDLAMHVALGKDWRGKKVDQGGVIYAALEGGHGTKNRIVAFREQNKISGPIPLAIIPSNINFLDGKTDMPAFLEAISSAEARLGNVKLIVIDTLARAISGGDENSSQAMGQLIINADKLREITGAHIAFVHHSGKDDLKGARGHSSLRAAVDTEIEISRPDTESPSTIKIVKQREMEMIEDMSFSLTRVVLGVNRRGKEVTSCVVTPCDNIEKRPSSRMTAAQKFIYDEILNCMISKGQTRTVMNGVQVNSITYDEFYDQLEQAGYKPLKDGASVKSSTQAARIALKHMKKINFTRNHIWVIENE